MTAPRYESIVKALNTSNETVLALGANFSHSADSHLVAMQVSYCSGLEYRISQYWTSDNAHPDITLKKFSLVGTG